MHNRRLNLTRQQTLLVGAAAIILFGVAWYLFRPELLFVNRTVNEPLPASMAAASETDSSPVALARGMFHKVAHETKGTAAIYELNGGKKVVRLTGFETSNGPDVHVYLVAAADASDSSTVTQAGFLDLGSLKGNIGDQNYDIPEGADMAKYHAVTVWCKRFSVNFGTAPLSDKKMAGSIMGEGKMAKAKMNEERMMTDAKTAGSGDRKLSDGKMMYDTAMSEAKMSEGKMMTDNKMSDNKMGDKRMSNDNLMSTGKMSDGKMTGKMDDGKM
jgi:hypothetical protein